MHLPQDVQRLVSQNAVASPELASLGAGRQPVPESSQAAVGAWLQRRRRTAWAATARATSATGTDAAGGNEALCAGGGTQVLMDSRGGGPAQPGHPPQCDSQRSSTGPHDKGATPSRPSARPASSTPGASRRVQWTARTSQLPAALHSMGL